MKITYKNRKIEKVCNSPKEARKVYGNEMARKIRYCIEQIVTFETIEELILYKIGRCHSLKGNRNGQYAMDLIHPYRLIFEKKGNEIQIANIIEIVDYH